jgi:VWFA-related protein
MPYQPWLLPLALLMAVASSNAQTPPDSQGSQTVAKPRKVDPSTPGDSGDQSIPSKLSPKAGRSADPDVSFKAEANVVTVDVAVLDNKGNPIPNIPERNFRILEDNVPQTLTQYSVGDAPLTVALVVEFSNRFQSFWSEGWYETLVAVQSFAQTLRPDDYVAIVAYDLNPEILCDFTADRGMIAEAINRLRIPGFSESNMFDAVTDTAARMSNIEGRKAIVLITSGIDTLSHITYDQTRRKLQESGVPVYTLGILQLTREMMEAQGMLGGARDITFLQGDNELRTFAKETGGQAYFPRFLQEMPEAFQAIDRTLRRQYTLGYSPTNRAKDGGFRKLTVQLIDPQTNQPLRVVDDKGKPMKYTIIARSGYTASRPVE